MGSKRAGITYEIRTRIVQLLVLWTVLFPVLSLACDCQGAHPGVPHEKWVNFVDNLNAKTEADKQRKASAPAPDSKPDQAKAERRRGRSGEEPRAGGDGSSLPATRKSPGFQSMGELGR